MTLIGAMTHVPGTRGVTLGRVTRRLDIPYRIIPDTHLEGVWPTTRRAWLSILDRAPDEGATHGIVLQDDMLPCRRFRATVEAAIAARPKVPIVIFCARPAAVAHARTRGHSWIESADGAWGGAVVLPIDMAREFVDWCDRHVDPAYPHDDGRLTLWAFWTGRRFWLTVPSLVEHLLPRDSLLGHHGGFKRTAAWYVDDPPAIDWTPALNAPTSHGRMGPVTRRESDRIARSLIE